MSARPGRLVGLVLACLALLGSPLAAQQRPAERDTTPRTPEERVQLRLRTLRPVAARDTFTAEDTLRGQRRTGRGGGPDEFGGQRSATPTAGASQIERDSLMTELAKLGGFVVTEYAGEEAVFKADSGHLELLRSALVVREGQQLAADSLVTYNDQTGRACGFGKPTATGGSMEPIKGDSLCYDIHSQRAMAANVETSISQGANWRFMGKQVYFENERQTIYGHDAIFTDCDLPFPHPHYYFGAKEAKVVTNNVLVAKNVTLNFADVPVFWLPFMVQSLSRGRRSGILMPRFGINDIARNSTRYARRIEDVGFYFALSDYLGAEVAMDWMSNNYTSLRGSFDYNVTRSFLQGGLTFRRYFPAEGGNQFTVSSSNSWQPDERTRMSMSANYTTSSRFVRQRTLDPRELTRSIDSNLNINRQFNWGSLTLGGTRNQYLTDGTVRMTLPSFGLNLSSITLFRADPGEERWFSNATWTGTVDGRVESNLVGDSSRDVRSQSRRNVSSNLSSSFTLGKLGISQSMRFNDERLDARDVRPERVDTVISLPERSTRRASWSTGINFQQNLIGTTTTFTPSLSLNGELLENDSSGGRMVASPTRLDFAASVQTALFGFYPGIGPLSRIRHRVTPSVSYTYSPAPVISPLQSAVFGLAVDTLTGRSTIGERNVLTFGISQTFEGKRKPRAQTGDVPGGTPAMVPGGATPAEQDSAALELAGPGAAGDTATGPRRLPAGDAPIILLSISTDAVVYDFVAAREGKGIQTTQISNSLQSDLFRNLQLRFTHDLWRVIPASPGGEGVPGTAERREFAPHLSSLNASLTLNSDSWLFRVLGLGRSNASPTPNQANEAGPQQNLPPGAGPAIDRTRAENGLVGTRRRDPIGPPAGALGSWNASLNYTLSRPRTVGAFDTGENQMVTGTFSFQPTQNWTLNWSTGYNITVGGFTDHMLTLSRRLHDWDANFDFAKVQNGNLSFQFRVALRANPDIKLDYEQHDLSGLPQQRFF